MFIVVFFDQRADLGFSEWFVTYCYKHCPLFCLWLCTSPSSITRPVTIVIILHTTILCCLATLSTNTTLIYSHWSPSGCIVCTKCSLPVSSYRYYVRFSSGRKYSLCIDKAMFFANRLPHSDFLYSYLEYQTCPILPSPLNCILQVT